VGTGVGASASGSTTVAAGRYGNGLLFDAAADQVAAATTDFSPSIGAIEFWYQPRYDSSTDATRRILWYWQASNNCFMFEKTAARALVLSVVVGATNQACTLGTPTTYSTTVAAGTYSWRPYDWVHLKTTWNSAGGLRKLRIVINGVERSFSNSFSAPAGSGQPVFGGCSANCPAVTTGPHLRRPRGQRLRHELVARPRGADE